MLADPGAVAVAVSVFFAEQPAIMPAVKTSARKTTIILFVLFIFIPPYKIPPFLSLSFLTNAGIFLFPLYSQPKVLIDADIQAGF